MMRMLLEPMRERRAQYESNMSLVREALEQGSKRARAIAQDTMELVRASSISSSFEALMCRQVCGLLRDEVPAVDR